MSNSSSNAASQRSREADPNLAAPVTPAPPQAPKQTDSWKERRRKRGISRAAADHQGRNRSKSPKKSNKGNNKSQQDKSQQDDVEHREPRPSPSVPSPAAAGPGAEELSKWLFSLDSGGALQRYLPALHREFASLEELGAAMIASAEGSASVLQCIEPSVFEILGVESLGHRLMLAKGIVSLNVM